MDGPKVCDLHDGERGVGDSSLPRLPGTEGTTTPKLSKKAIAPCTPRKKKRIKATSDSVLSERNENRLHEVGDNNRRSFSKWQSCCLQLQRDATRLAKVLRAEEILERTVRRSERIDPGWNDGLSDNGESLRPICKISQGVHIDKENNGTTKKP